MDVDRGITDLKIEFYEDELKELFFEINRDHFNATLKEPELRWNSRLRASAGRFIPAQKIEIAVLDFIVTLSPAIEIAAYLKNTDNSAFHIWDTLAHEMIHYWLWSQKKPYGHTHEFKLKMKEMGVSRYNSVPVLKKHKYIYACSYCEKEFYAKRKWKSSACLSCCKKYNEGHYHANFKLYLKEILN